jgi:16S rRNA (uracil1498-N3)-methyltransferase
VNLIILESSELGALGEVTLRDVRAAHLLRVLGVRPGAFIRVGLLDGPFGTGEVTHTTDDAVTLSCTLEPSTPSRPPVDLLLALPRPKVLRRLWAQLAALGVGRIMVTNAARVERNYFDTHVLDPAFYRALLIEGLQQARDTRLPLVTVHRQFRVFVEDHLNGFFSDGIRLVADPRSQVRVRDAAGGAADRHLLAVGPEGGWNDFELDLLEQHGFRTVGIGPRTLRVDTACVALLAILQDSLVPPMH